MTPTQQKALADAEAAFRRYGTHHHAKGAYEKAVANYALADQMLDALLDDPDIDPSCDDKKLAEIIMSDCGHSSDHTRLLERITDRIAAHVAKQKEDPRRAVLLVDATSTKPAERAYRSIKADPPPIGVRLNLLTTHGAHTQGVLSPLNMSDFLGWEPMARIPPGMIT